MTKIIAACVQMRSGVEVAPNIAAASALIREADVDPSVAEEIAAAVLYLASAEAAYVTGSTLHVNGGMAML